MTESGTDSLADRFSHCNTYMHWAHSKHTHGLSYESTKQVAADTMECLSMQETLCLGGKRSFEENPPRDTQPPPELSLYLLITERERAMEREGEMGEGGDKLKGRGD